MISAQDHHCYVRLVIIAISAIGFRFENLLKIHKTQCETKRDQAAGKWRLFGMLAFPHNNGLIANGISVYSNLLWLVGNVLILIKAYVAFHSLEN